MARILNNARRLRLERQLKQNRTITLQEAAEAMGIERAALTRIEQNRTSRIDFETLIKICQYYEVNVGDILEFVEGELVKGEGNDDEIESLEAVPFERSSAASRLTEEPILADGSYQRCGCSQHPQRLHLGPIPWQRASAA